MTASSFEVKEHVIPCQHIRGYPHATRDATAVLKLAIKQYTPKSATAGVSPAVTIIATHANGIPKETYEPLWEELTVRMNGRLRAIWIADCSHQGASGVLNEHLQGDDPNWFDHSRDLLAMVNHFRDEIQPPIIGIAHSMGCAQLVELSHIHPRLFQSLILMEPVIQDAIPPGPNAAMMTSHRPDFWTSASEARASFLNNKFYKTWDHRALNKYLEFGLRSTPTALYPDGPAHSVTLTTTKHQEAWSYVRSTFSPRPPNEQLHDQERMLTADYAPSQAEHIFHRAEPGLAYKNLPDLQPAVLWIFADRSYINRPADREDKVSRTGVAARGSGGVSSALIKMAGHSFPLEKIAQTADVIAPYIEKQLERYQTQSAFWNSIHTQKSERDMQVLSKKWMQEVQLKSDAQRSRAAESKL